MVCKKFIELGNDLVVGCASKRLFLFRQILAVVSSHYSAYPPQLTSFDDWVDVVDHALEYCLKTCPIKDADLSTGVTLMGYDKQKDRVRCFAWDSATRFECSPGTLVALQPFDEDEHITERIAEHVSMSEATTPPERVREAMARVVAELAAKYPAKVGLPLFFHIVEAGGASESLADAAATYGRAKLTALTDGEVDLSKSGVINRNLGNISDDVGSDRRAATANQKVGGDRGFNALDDSAGSTYMRGDPYHSSAVREPSTVARTGDTT
ncbi:MAG: hypothetical protein ACRD5F_15215, partial [Candidatus Acidiferrales bacterium]